jgi:hypothetical protein
MSEYLWCCIVKVNYIVRSNKDPPCAHNAVSRSGASSQRVSCRVISKSDVFKFVTFQIILYLVIVHAVLSFSVPAVCAVFAMVVIVLMMIGT